MDTNGNQFNVYVQMTWSRRLAIGGVVTVFLLICVWSVQYRGSLSNYGRGTVQPAIHINVHLARNTSGKPPCTFRALRQYYHTHHKLAGDGRWDTSTNRFHLDICQLEAMSRGRIAQCLLDNDVISVMTYGDSQGVRMFKGLMSVFGQNACVLVDKEELISKGFEPDDRYYNRKFMISNITFGLNKRNCRTCGGRRYHCRIAQGNIVRNISFEHLAGMTILSSSNAVVVNNKSETNSKPTTISLQELYVKYFIRNIRPDVFLISTPFNHARSAPPVTFLKQILQLKQLIDKHVPKTTKVVFVTTAREFGDHYTKRNWNAEARNKMIDTLTKGLYKIFERDLLNQSSNIYALLDSYKISESREIWSLDGIHLQKVWYEKIMSIFWNLYCNSANFNQF